MKKILYIFVLLSVIHCTGKFEEYNTDLTIIPEKVVSLKSITSIQKSVFLPNRYPFWRGPIIHADRIGGYLSFGFNGCWWTGEAAYEYHSGYTDAMWGTYFGQTNAISEFLKATEGNAPQKGIALIMKAILYHRLTTIWGDIPFSQVSTGVATPQYDEQKKIYKTLISELGQAVDALGDKTETDKAIGTNDLFYRGDMGKWAKLGNSLRLKLAIQAYGSEGDDFAANAVKKAFDNGKFLESANDDAKLVLDYSVSQWNATSYLSVWWDFGGFGSKFSITKPLIDMLKKANDPRLAKWAEAVTFPANKKDTLTRTSDIKKADFDKFVDEVLIKSLFEGRNATQRALTDSTVELTIPAGQDYLGQPLRTGSKFAKYIKPEYLSFPSSYIRGTASNLANTVSVIPSYVLSAAETYFYRAEAIERGIGGVTGNKAAMYEKGIQEALAMHGIGKSGAVSILDSYPYSMENLYNQLWLSQFGAHWSGWSTARRTGYPRSITKEVSDSIYFLGAELKGRYPQRLRYSSDESAKNKTNYDQAASRLSEGDKMASKIWVFTKP